ncbi:MAG TPA: DnaA regulatory inactivator Hda [Steroidobacteraceae bacterium]|nr:DnaA regulatory inactivator Hda [Steroidobacteraceae bacterium]
MKQLALGVKLRADAVFESFAPGANAEIVAALRAPRANPVWIWGAHGSGKTHLLQAVCAAAAQKAAYFPLNRALGLPPEALSGFETCAVLCVDDIDAVAGDLDWERALFRLFNASAELHTRLIFAANAAPRSLAWALEDWKSRAAACVVYQLRELDEAGRIEALCLHAAQRGLQLPRETADFMLHRFPRDLPSLLGLLDTLDEESLAAQRRLTIPFIRVALEKSAKTPP